MSPEVKLFDRLEIHSPWMNAAGFLGYFPPSQTGWHAPMGAFVTNPVSLAPRNPARNRLVQPFAGGFLLHTGLPNPGMASVLLQFAEKWSKIPVPVWVHLLPQTPADLPHLIQPLEELENIGAIEVGLPPGLPLRLLLEFIEAGNGEIPLLICLGVDEIQSEWVQPMMDSGAAGVVLSAPRGILKVNQTLSRGRLYGPSVFPLMLKMVCRLAQFDLPVIAGGGVYTQTDGETLLDAGASAVQLDAVLWHNNDD